INREKAKVMDEHELEVQDFELLKAIFKELSLSPVYEFKKHRTTYEFNKTHFEIDKYPGIPAFLEIEAPDLETINEMVSKLGFSPDEANSYSIKEVLEHYGKIRS
ncbi:MAG: CYTH domain-containing protein, partial [candidate division WOR-3 bacterium]